MEVKLINNSAQRTRHIKKSLIAGISLAMVALPNNARAVNFMMNDITPGGMSAEALAGVQQASDIWASLLTDDITVNLNINFTELSPGEYGSAGSQVDYKAYRDVRGQLNAKSSSAHDAIAVAHLQTSSFLVFTTTDHLTGEIILDNDRGANNYWMRANRANLKALGLIDAHDSGNDADLNINSTRNWDYDPTDGIDAGKNDFVGVILHEMGHALGFTSGVSYIDRFSNPNPGGEPRSFSGSAIFTPIDLYRYSAPDQLSFAAGGAPYFSIDGGNTALANYSTGVFNGDGASPPHWKSGEGIGIMAPSLITGQRQEISPIDLIALDVMGYTVVPEPSIVLLLCIGMSYLSIHRRRR